MVPETYKTQQPVIVIPEINSGQALNLFQGLLLRGERDLPHKIYLSACLSACNAQADKSFPPQQISDEDLGG